MRPHPADIALLTGADEVERCEATVRGQDTTSDVTLEPSDLLAPAKEVLDPERYFLEREGG